MIFKTLHEASKRGELILSDGGMCHWHLRRNGQITIREIIVLPEQQHQGIGKTMLDRLRQVDGATSIFAKCPVDLPANGWYEAMGFEDEGIEKTRTGSQVRKWRLYL